MAKQVDATYGNALFELAVEENKIDELYEQTKELLQIIDENSDLIKLLCHPHIDKEDKKKVVKSSFDGRIMDELTGLLVMMVEKDHAQNITDVLNFFIKQVKLEKKIGVVYITSAIELKEEQKVAIEKRLLETTDYETLEPEYKVDKSLIGGLVIRIEDRVVDSSIKTKLDSMSKVLAKA